MDFRFEVVFYPKELFESVTVLENNVNNMRIIKTNYPITRKNKSHFPIELSKGQLSR